MPAIGSFCASPFPWTCSLWSHFCFYSLASLLAKNFAGAPTLVALLLFVFALFEDEEAFFDPNALPVCPPCGALFLDTGSYSLAVDRTMPSSASLYCLCDSARAAVLSCGLDGCAASSDTKPAVVCGVLSMVSYTLCAESQTRAVSAPFFWRPRRPFPAWFCCEAAVCCCYSWVPRCGAGVWLLSTKAVQTPTATNVGFQFSVSVGAMFMPKNLPFCSSILAFGRHCCIAQPRPSGARAV